MREKGEEGRKKENNCFLVVDASSCCRGVLLVEFDQPSGSGRFQPPSSSADLSRSQP